MTTKADLERWFREGKKQKATHIIVACDTFSYEDYPVYIKKGEDVSKRIADYMQNMQTVMEVYDLSKSEKEQIGSGKRVSSY